MWKLVLDMSQTRVFIFPLHSSVDSFIQKVPPSSLLYYSPVPDGSLTEAMPFVQFHSKLLQLSFLSVREEQRKLHPGRYFVEHVLAFIQLGLDQCLALGTIKAQILSLTILF